VGTIAAQTAKALRNLRWLPAYAWQRLGRRHSRGRPEHLIIAMADHFEPAIMPNRAFAPLPEQERRLERWCREYPRLVDPWRDADGRPFRRTYFYPAEQYEKGLIDRLAAHCAEGWGEVEIHLHHGVDAPDTAEATRDAITSFRDALVRHGCLSHWEGDATPRYAFAHGNWALANSAGGRCCGVDEEMRILAETGCYADFTLPSAPDPTQVAKINALYECALPLEWRAPHRRGRDLTRGRPPSIFPLIVQGPLGINFDRRIRGWRVPCVENGGVSGLCPPTMHRLRLWRRAAITVRGRPDWVFVKLHCHGMDPDDAPAMLGEPMRQFLKALTEGARAGGDYAVHFVTAREMVNIMLAACDGREGDPGLYREHRLRLITPVPGEASRLSEGSMRRGGG
jgi:hypothetical protein